MYNTVGFRHPVSPIQEEQTVSYDWKSSYLNVIVEGGSAANEWLIEHCYRPDPLTWCFAGFLHASSTGVVRVPNFYVVGQAFETFADCYDLLR